MSNEYSEENTGKLKVFLLYQVANGCIQLAILLAGLMQNQHIILLELCGLGCSDFDFFSHFEV
jgi:hypothetical protein